MCGIAGVIGFDKKTIEQDILLSMMQDSKHQGQEGHVYTNEYIGLGYVGCAHSQSPVFKKTVTDASGRYTIILNGSVYNAIELRNELQAIGYTFALQTNDIEVVLNGYIAWGEMVLDRINGMFVMAIYDKEKENLFIARDRFGVKSLYYYVGEHYFVFASEISPILNILPKKPKANENVIFDYLVFNRTDQTEDTFFDGIYKLQHGCAITIDLKKTYTKESLPICRWYDLSEHVQKVKDKYAKMSIDEAKAEYMRIFKRAIELRLISDMPWGVCLSGGLDSSAITATIIKELKQPDVHSFSAVYGKNSKADESKFIDEFQGIVPNMHYIHPDADTLFNHLDEYVNIQQEPTPTTSPYALYSILTEASKSIKIILDGQGSDEALAGYEYIPGLYYKTLFTHLQWGRLAKEIIQYAQLHKSWRHVKYMLFFMMPNRMRTKVRVMQRGYINPTFVERHKDSVIADKLYGASTMEEMLVAHFEYKLEHLTKWGDRNTMAFGVEGRSPFLDKDLVEYSIALKDGLKIKSGYTKYILREVMKNIMPEKVRLRVDKKGFSVPQDEWFRTKKFQNLVEDILQSESFARRGYFVPEEAKKLYQQHLKGEINISKDIWKWINLELWFRKYID